MAGMGHEAVEPEQRMRMQESREFFQGRRIRRYAAAMQSHVDLQSDRDASSRDLSRLRKGCESVRAVSNEGNRGPPAFRRLEKRNDTIGVDHGIGDQDVLETCMDKDLRLAGLGSGQATRAMLLLKGSEFNRFVSLHVRPQQNSRLSSNGGAFADIAKQALLLHQDERRLQIREIRPIC